jgi:hypothetical protein
MVSDWADDTMEMGMKRSSTLQLVGLMLGWTGWRGIAAARSGAESVNDLLSLLLTLSALAVGAAALFAAVAVWRMSRNAARLTGIWAVLLLSDLVLQELVRGSSSVWFTGLILAGIACLLLAVVQHVQHYTDPEKSTDGSPSRHVP